MLERRMCQTETLICFQSAAAMPGNGLRAAVRPFEKAVGMLKYENFRPPLEPEDAPPPLKKRVEVSTETQPDLNRRRLRDTASVCLAALCAVTSWRLGQ